MKWHVAIVCILFLAQASAQDPAKKQAKTASNFSESFAHQIFILYQYIRDNQTDEDSQFIDNELEEKSRFCQPDAECALIAIMKEYDAARRAEAKVSGEWRLLRKVLGETRACEPAAECKLLGESIEGAGQCSLLVDLSITARHVWTAADNNQYVSVDPAACDTVESVLGKNFRLMHDAFLQALKERFPGDKERPDEKR